MEHPPEVIATLDALLAGEEHVVGYSGNEVGAERGIRLYVEDEGVSTASEIAGRPVVEVLAIGRPENHTRVEVGADPTKKVRPLLGGLSISGSGGGTLGYFVKLHGDALALISCSHVLKSGTPNVVQPWDSTESVATLTASILAPDDGVDAASATLLSGIGATLELNELWKVTGTGTPSDGDTVKKSGAASRVTTGTVSDTNAVAKFVDGTFKHMIAVKGATPFSSPGDSGALVVLENHLAVGVNKGGSPIAFACPIGPVLAKLNATLAT